MSKIDVTKIEGYDTMSAEDKLKALESYEFETDYSGYVKKDAFDKTSSELAELKRKEKERLSEDERLKAEREEEFNAMREKLEALENEKKLSELKAEYIGLGYDNELAESTAKAYLKGDMKAVFKNQKTYQEQLVNSAKQSSLQGTPRPNAQNDGEKVITKEQFNKMSLKERVDLYNENKELYETLKGE